MRNEVSDMAQNDKVTYESYEKDEFDNPPMGPVGVHRGARSVGARVTPYVVVIIVAILAGLLFWSMASGELSKIDMLPWNTSSQSKVADSYDQSGAEQTDASSDGDSDQSSTADSTGDAADDDTSTADTSSSDDSNASDPADDTQQPAVEQTVNKATSVRVVNATGISGYAAQHASELTSAGYTNVVADNPAGVVPAYTVVWYQNETDKATAEDVAATLGITAVEQSDGLATPIVVVLLD